MTDTTPEGKTFEHIFSVIPVGMTDYAEDDAWQIGGIDALIRLLVAG